MHSHSCPEKLLSLFIQRQKPSWKAAWKQSRPCWHFVLYLNLDFKQAHAQNLSPYFISFLTLHTHCKFWFFPLSTFFCHHIAAFEYLEYWLGFIYTVIAEPLARNAIKSLNNCISHWISRALTAEENPAEVPSIPAGLPCVLKEEHSHWACLPLWVSLLGFLGLSWWETGGRRAKGTWPCYSNSGWTNYGCGVEKVLTFTSLFALHPHWCGTIPLNLSFQ